MPSTMWLIDDFTISAVSGGTSATLSAISRAAVLEGATWDRLVASGGATTASGRVRPVYQILLQAMDRKHRGIQLLGVRRVPQAVPAVSPLEYIAGREHE